MSLLDAHPDLLLVTSKGYKRNAFHWLASTNQVVVLRQILQPLLVTPPAPRGEEPEKRISSPKPWPAWLWWWRTPPPPAGESPTRHAERIKRCLEARDALGRTPIWDAAAKGHLEILLLMLATHLPLRINARIRDHELLEPTLRGTTPAQVAGNLGHQEVVGWLEAYQGNPDQTRARARRELGLATQAAEVYALLAFLHEDLLVLA